MIEFLNKLAIYCNARCSGYDYTLDQAKDMHVIAVGYTAELIYLLQFNYEDCSTVEEWKVAFVNNLS